MKTIIRVLILLFALCANINAQEADSTSNNSLHDDVHAAFVVISPGDTPGSLLGHIAIRMWCPSAGLDYCFTGKIPDWGNEFVTSVFKKVKLGIIPEETKAFREDYRSQGRGITEYELDLSLEEKQKLWMLLDQDVEKGLAYDMDYIRHGCAIIATNKVLAAISDRHIDLSPIINQCIEGDTRREILLRYKNFDSWEGFIGHSIFGGSVDEYVSGDAKLIMPQDVISVFGAANLIHGSNVICKPSVKAEDDTFLSPMVLAFIFFVLCYVKLDIMDYPIMAIQTLIGLFLCAVVFLSPAPGTEWNWLILAFNPITSVLFWTKNNKIHIALSIVTLTLILYMIYNVNSMFCLSQILIVGGLYVREIYKIYNYTNIQSTQN